MNNINYFLNHLIGSLAVLGLIGISIPARAEKITGESGNIQAELSYDKAQEYQYKNVRLKITRAGQTVLDRQLSSDAYERPLGSLTEENKLPVLDLDGDREPEVIADFFTGGAHCCTYSLIYRYNRNSQQYTQLRHEWGNAGYRLQDVDDDGLPEFYTRDDRFAYAFAAYAASGYPLQIWQYRQGKMIDVTGRYPKLIYNQAYELWQTYTELRKQGIDGKGFLAAYLASKYMLGQQQDGWRRLQQAYQGSDRTQYFAALRKFLQETGYTKFSQTKGS